LDVHAKAADPNVTAAQIRLMLRSLLIERFAMVAREDRRERPVYALVQARVGNLGPKLRRVDTDCDVFWRSVQDGKTPMPGPPPPSGLVSTCLLRSAPRAGTIHSGGLTMANLAQILYPATERLVIDKTGLTGHFSFELDYQPLSVSTDSPDVPALPSVFAALEEQLGLKLTSERAPVPVVIVERVEHPTPD